LVWFDCALALTRPGTQAEVGSKADARRPATTPLSHTPPQVWQMAENLIDGI